MNTPSSLYENNCIFYESICVIREKEPSVEYSLGGRIGMSNTSDPEKVDKSFERSSRARSQVRRGKLAEWLAAPSQTQLRQEKRWSLFFFFFFMV